MRNVIRDIRAVGIEAYLRGATSRLTRKELAIVALVAGVGVSQVHNGVTNLAAMAGETIESSQTTEIINHHGEYTPLGDVVEFNSLLEVATKDDYNVVVCNDESYLEKPCEYYRWAK